MKAQPYLFFEGRCEEAIAFYQSAVGATVVSQLRFSDTPGSGQHRNLPPGAEDKIMHAQFHIGDTSIYASDGMCQRQANFQGFALSLTVENTAEAERIFNALADGGQIKMPIAKTFFSPAFGMLDDRFGVSWQVYVA